MSPLLRKEIRLLLPFFGIAMLLALVPAWIFPRESFAWHSNQSPFWAFGFGVTLLALAPFGQEFSFGTFSCLLAQPFERNRIWRTKMLLILIAVAIVLIAFILSINARLGVILSDAAQRLAVQGPHDYLDLQIKEMVPKNWIASDIWGMSFLLAAAAVGGGLWTTLLFRQTGAALWFTILVPGAIFIAVQILLHSFSGQAQEITLAIVLTTYSAIGLFRARRMFLNAQDSQWLGETISLLALTPAKTSNEPSTTGRGKKPLRALLRKEFQSHQISLLVGFGLLVLHACTLAFRKFYTLPPNSELRFAVEAVPFLWLFVPWLIGSVTVAEEHKLGTIESQLCLPVTRRFQFIIKLAIALLLGIALGGLMPSLVEWIGTRFHVSSEIIGGATRALSNLVSTDPFDIREYLDACQRAAIMCVGAVFITTVSFFASTLSRNTLHALGAAVVFGIAFFLLFQWVTAESSYYEYSLWKGPLIFITGVPVAIISVVWLSFSNYKRLHAGRNLWLRNLLILSAALFSTGIGTAVIYQRPWELAMSLEPHHGGPRLSGPIQPAICMPLGRVFALLPDGRLWAGAGHREKEFDQYEEVWDSQAQSNRLQKLRMYLPTTGVFVGGSNWVTLAANNYSVEVAALQSDGTLWQILAREDMTNRAAWFSSEPRPHRIGSDSDWKWVATSQRYFLAIKADGTLWGWGHNEQHLFAPDLRYRIREPVQIGSDSDWAMVFSKYSEPLLMKTDGTIFNWAQVEHEDRFEMRRSNFNGKDWSAVAGGFGERNLVLRRDGTLWGAYLPKVLFGDHNSEASRRSDILTRIGGRSDWAQISGENFIAAIRKDGSLVANETQLFSPALGQPSKYSDWVALDASWNGLVALASDGTVSLWWDTRSRAKFLLAPTHRPLWSLNVLADPKN